jgi:hypothetical protein
VSKHRIDCWLRPGASQDETGGRYQGHSHCQQCCSQQKTIWQHVKDMQAGYPVNNAHTTTNVIQWRGMDDPNTIGHLSVSTGTTTANAITSWKRLQKIQSGMPVQQKRRPRGLRYMKFRKELHKLDLLQRCYFQSTRWRTIRACPRGRCILTAKPVRMSQPPEKGCTIQMSSFANGNAE